jgi:hypothetical protein
MCRMAASSSSPPASKYRRPGWRYSLRAFLIFFTLICVGVWYWFRVPYREEVIHSDRPPWGGMGLFAEEGKVYAAAKEVRRFRRVLRGDPIREGVTEYFDKEGNRLGEESWREGKLHGTFIRWYPTGKVHEQGQYDLGGKTGVWELFDAAGNLVLRNPYDVNWPHGEAQWFADGKVIRNVRYDRGEVKQIDGRDIDDPLGRLRRDGKIDDERIIQMLQKPAEADFLDTPLIEVTDYIASNYRVNVALDKRALSDARLTEDTPITLHEDNRITAQLMLILLCDPHDLAATYRFGMIWLTTKDSAKNWTDRTGVSQLLTAAPADSSQDTRERIAAAWAKPAAFDFLDTSRSEICRHLADTYQVPLECDAWFSDVPLSSSLSGISLQNALSVLCEEAHLRIRWKDADTLVMEIRPKEPPAPSNTGR